MQEGRRKEERREKEKGEGREGVKEEKREEGREGERRKQRKRQKGGAGGAERREGLLQSFQLTLISNFVLLSELEMYIGFAFFFLTFKEFSKISHPLIIL